MQGNDWSFDMNLAGVTPAGVGSRELPTGFYTAKVIEAEAETSQNGRPQVKIRVEITDADFAGIPRTTRIGIPQSADDKVRYFWRSLLESVGYTPAQIDAGAVKMSAKLLTDRECFVHYTQGDKDAGVYDNLRFLTPATFAAGKRAADAQPGSAAATGMGGIGVSASAPTASAGIGGIGGMGGIKPVVTAQKAATNSNDLLKALGVAGH